MTVLSNDGSSFWPSHYLKFIKGSDGLFKASAQLGSYIWRAFCFFDEVKLVIIPNGFTKKTQKTPAKEFAKAVALMEE